MLSWDWATLIPALRHWKHVVGLRLGHLDYCGAGTLSLQQVRTLLLTRVLSLKADGKLVFPQLRQRLVRRLGGFVWEEAPLFGIHNHVFKAEAEKGQGGWTEDHLRSYIGRLSGEALTEDRPLWEVRLLPTQAQRDTILLLRVHQALADGTSLLRILTEALCDKERKHAQRKPTFASGAFCVNVLRAVLVGPLTLLLWLLTTQRDRNFFTQPGAEAGRRRKEGSGEWGVAWAAGLSVPQVTRLKHVLRSSFNDVLFGAAAGSMRKFLQEEGLLYPHNLRAVVPVDLRTTSPTQRKTKPLGWKAASILTTLPTGLEGAIPRLWATRQRSDELKASADPVVAYCTTAILMHILPQSIAAAILDSITNKASVQIGSLRGPQAPLTVDGFVLKGLYTFLPPPGDVPLALTLFTYADQVHATVLAHPSLGDAPKRLLRGITLQVEQLSRQLSQRKLPGEKRRTNQLHTHLQRPHTFQIHVQLQMVQKELQSLRQAGEHAPLNHKARRTSLKDEFSELMGELRRRSSIVEGFSISFEDEEAEEEFRKPRKRALSVAPASRRPSLFPLPRYFIPPSDSDLSTHSPSPPPSRPTPSPIRTTAV